MKAPPPRDPTESLAQRALALEQAQPLDPSLFYVMGGLGALSLALSLRYVRKVSIGETDTSPVTIGPHAKATFVTPDFGLPPRFAILRYGTRRHVLTLGQHM